MSKESVGNIIAYWNVEHTVVERDAHLLRVQEIIQLLGYQKILKAKDVSFPKWDSKPDSLGFPATRIDVTLAPRFRGRTWREAGTNGTVKNLNVIHLAFRKNAGVYGMENAEKAKKVKDRVTTEEEALKVNEWKGWQGYSCEFTLCTDAKWRAYRHRNWCGYDGRNDLGDSFGYDSTWSGLRSQLATALRHIVEGLGISRAAKAA